MGRYDDISDTKLRYEVQRFARILQRMEENGEVLDRTGDILTLLGELRRMVFAWEVRCTFQDDDVEATQPSSTDDEESASERIVREALEQEASFLEGLDRGEEETGEEPDDDEGEDPS